MLEWLTENIADVSSILHNLSSSQEKLDEFDKFLDYLKENNATVLTYSETYAELLK